MDYALVITATVLLAIDFSISKKYQSVVGTSPAVGLIFNMANGLLTAIIFWAIGGFKLTFSPFSAILASGMALCGLLYSLLGFRILKTGNMSLYSLFLMSGGMLVPYIYGLWRWDEEPGLWRILGVICILTAVALSNRAKSQVSAKLLSLCAAIFLLNGMVSILSKCHQIEKVYPTVESAGFVMYSGIARAIFSAAALPFFKREKTAEGGKFWSFSLLLAAGSAVIGGVSYLFQLIGAETLPATVLYPIVTGGSILFSTFAGKLFFKEKISTTQWISVGLCFVGTCLFL